jgi:DNA ligase 1
MPEGKKLYKQDIMGRTRQWWMEYNEEAYRTHSGLIDGAIVVSGWKYPTEKNVGKANGTTVAEQVLAEVESRYTIQQYQGKYAPTIEESKQGAKFIECMLASKYDVKKHQNFPYWSQPKLDGIRCLTFEEGMQSRNGKPLLSAPHIREVLQDFFDEFPEYILDGELYNHSLKNEFEKIISLARKSKPTQDDLNESAELVEYHVYDVITPEPMTYTQRKEFLETHILGRFKNVVVVPTVQLFGTEEVESKLGEYLEDGYEGQMLRVDADPYDQKRSKSLIKHKTFEDDEYIITDIIEGKGNWAGYAKAVEILLPDGTTQQSGMRGTQAFAKELLENKQDYLGGKSQVTVRYQNKTGDGKLRFPVVVAFWKGGRDL